MIGPRTLAAQELHAAKYRQRNESFDDYCVRYARTTADDDKHFRLLLDGLRSQALLPAGRQQRAVGWPFLTTAFNCFVGSSIHDSMEGIMNTLKDAALTLRSGGGCGWDFSPIRPTNEPVRRLGDGARASGPVPFMGMWNGMCETIRSAGERRGAMMGVLRVDHPDIMQFVRAKQNDKALTNFNISVAVTNKFMEAVYADGLYDLVFEGRVFNQVRATDVWSIIMENNWDWAEPGTLFIDRINQMNPLNYCEEIVATNPCGEQPLPPNGACLLFSLNVVKYLVPKYSDRSKYEIDYDKFRRDVSIVVRACDNVFESTVFPLVAQKEEAFAKRRMGVGVTGVANALEVCGYRYGTSAYIAAQDQLLAHLRDQAYDTSIDIAQRKGSFPLFDAIKWLDSGFAKTLPAEIRYKIGKHGLRNGLLLSIAPTGTISMAADNVSSGIEPPPLLESTRTILYPEGSREVALNDYAFEEFGVRGRIASDVSPKEHVDALCAAQKFVDSSISKTINVRGTKDAMRRTGEITFEEFKDVYVEAYNGGAKGCSTFNMNGKRMGIIKEQVAEAESCSFDPVTGAKICG